MNKLAWEIIKSKLRMGRREFEERIITTIASGSFIFLQTVFTPSSANFVLDYISVDETRNLMKSSKGRAYTIETALVGLIIIIRQELFMQCMHDPSTICIVCLGLHFCLWNAQIKSNRRRVTKKSYNSSCHKLFIWTEAVVQFLHIPFYNSECKTKIKWNSRNETFTDH